MFKFKNKMCLLTLSLYGALNCNLVIAAQTSSSFIITGPAITNEYIGSKERETVPMVISNFQLGQFEFEVEGLSARAAVINNHDWTIGVAGTFDFGRDNEITNNIVASFEPIDSNAGLGLYFNRSFSNQWLEEDSLDFRVSAVKDVSNVHNGVLTTFTSSYTFPLYLPWRFEFEVEATHSDSNYTNRYFGVSEIDSKNSGLSQYRAGSGFRDISFNSNIGFFINSHWGAFMRIGYSRLLNDAADSPIVIQQGSVNQTFVGLGLFHRF